MAKQLLGGDGNYVFNKAADGNYNKVKSALLRLVTLGTKQLPAHDARGVLELIRKKDKMIPSDTAHQSLVGRIVKTEGYTYKPRSTKR